MFFEIELCNGVRSILFALLRKDYSQLEEAVLKNFNANCQNSALRMKINSEGTD